MIRTSQTDPEHTLGTDAYLERLERAAATRSARGASRPLSGARVKARAVELIRQHAARLGMDQFAAETLAAAVAALPTKS